MLSPAISTTPEGPLMEFMLPRAPVSSMRLKLSFSIVPGEYSIARLGPAEAVPAWAFGGGFSSVTRTPEELSIVSSSSAVPPGVRSEPGWALLKLSGPFAFDQVGVLESFLRPLAAAGVSIVAISTFDTDYVLVKGDGIAEAVAALAAAGYEIRRST